MTVNGKVAGSLAACPDHVCVFSNVALSAGDNRVVASGTFPSGPVSDWVQWHLSDAAAKSTNIDCGALVAGTAPGKQFGSDTFFEGGTAALIAGKQANPMRPPAPVVIRKTDAQEIASSYRTGTFRYTIPATDGRHTVVLTFVDLEAGGRARIQRAGER